MCAWRVAVRVWRVAVRVWRVAVRVRRVATSVRSVQGERSGYDGLRGWRCVTDLGQVLQRQNRLMEVIRVHKTPRGCQAAYGDAAWTAPGSSVLTQLGPRWRLCGQGVCSIIMCAVSSGPL